MYYATVIQPIHGTILHNMLQAEVYTCVQLAAYSLGKAKQFKKLEKTQKALAREDITAPVITNINPSVLSLLQPVKIASHVPRDRLM